MYSFYVLLFLAIAFVVYSVIEYSRHQKRIFSIPVRIHVNGTRGKSSVTRLIGAGLRAGGIPTITKVTGTHPRLILEDGSETIVYRKSSANIIEQRSIVKFAAERNTQALVIECMALQPQYQWITENQMIHSTMSVMTNVRLDHVDIMGYTLPEIAAAMGNTIPKNGILFSSETEIPHILKKIAGKRNTVTHIIPAESVSDTEMEGFSYIEHRDNVALALAVCCKLGIDRESALEGMYGVVPDAGALMRYTVNDADKKLAFYNAFAANDPDSTFMIWNLIKNSISTDDARVILLNTRHDRLDRARQLAEMAGKRLSHEIDYLCLIGQSTEVVENMSIKFGMPKPKIINLGWTTPEKVYAQIHARTQKSATILAIGNMGGMGGQTVDYFEQLSHKNHD